MRSSHRFDAIGARRVSPGRKRRATVVVALTAVLAVLATACSDGQAASPSGTPGSTASGATPAAGITWTDCGERLECASVPMPLDWNDPGGATIDLAVIRHPASKPDQRIGTIFTDPGGPGDTGVGFVRDAGDQLDAWGDGRFDWIGWDPRGTHASTPVSCFTSEAERSEFWTGVDIPSTPAGSDAQVRRLEDLSRDVAAR